MNIIVEKGPEGHVEGSRIEVTPFKIFGLLSDSKILAVELVLGFRCFCVLWMLINTVVT